MADKEKYMPEPVAKPAVDFTGTLPKSSEMVGLQGQGASEEDWLKRLALMRMQMNRGQPAGASQAVPVSPIAEALAKYKGM